jgi:hypothetical protein
VRQIAHLIPERRDQQVQRARRRGRPLVFAPAVYARRNVVERCINRLIVRGVGSPRTMRSVLSIIEQWWPLPPSFSGSTPDSSDKRLHVYPRYTVASAMPFALLPPGDH